MFKQDEDSNFNYDLPQNSVDVAVKAGSKSYGTVGARGGMYSSAMGPKNQITTHN